MFLIGLLLARLIRLFCALLLQILLIRIAARAGLVLFMGGDAAFMGALLIFGFSFLATREFLRRLGGLCAGKGQAESTDKRCKE